MSDAKSILLIDGSDRDRRHYADVLKAVLSDAVFFEAENGQAGLALFRSRAVDAVILELTLPDMSGFEVLKQLAAPNRRVNKPIIVLTRLSYATILDVAKENGANATLIKKSTSDQMLRDTVLGALHPPRRIAEGREHLPSEQGKNLLGNVGNLF
ncbi:MAG TPA: response regulator [Nitrospira sp.]|nr:response regulator [Nitrospira sp.]